MKIPKNAVLLGYAGVDSGQLMICDPCYLRNWRDGDHDDKTSHYGMACEITTSKPYGGEIVVSKPYGQGVALSTGWGDGNYPVYAIIKDDRIASIIIDFFVD